MPLEIPHRSHFDLAVDARRALIALDIASAEDRERIVRLARGAGLQLETGLEPGAHGGTHRDDPTVIRFHQDVRVEVDGVALDREDFVLHQELRLKSSSAGGRRRRPPPLVAHSNRMAWVVGEHAFARAKELVTAARFGSRVTVAPVYYLPGPDRSLARRYSADPWFVDVRSKRLGPDVVLPAELQKFLTLRKEFPSSGGWLRAELALPMDLYDFAKLFLELAGEHLLLAVRGLPMVVPLAGVPTHEPLYSSQRPALDLIQAEAMWNTAATSATADVMVFYVDCGVFVGTADIAVDQTKSVLIDQPIPGGYQLGCTPATGDCHGTQMVGIAGAQWDGVGLAGVAGHIRVKHISLRCASLGNVSDALAYAATVTATAGAKGVVVIGLDVLQMYHDASLCAALLTDATHFEAAMHTAQTTSDLLIVMASGNYDPTASPPLSAIPAVPPDLSATLIVGACDHIGTNRFSDPTLALASRFGADLSLVAPGENVFTAFDATATPPDYASVWGTSFAAAHVAGVAALCRSTFPALTADRVKAKLLASATALTNPVPDPALELGMGRIDGSRAVT